MLNVSRNKLKALPAAMVKMTRLKMLLVNENQLDFDGIPSGIGQLVRLEVFQVLFGFFCDLWFV